MAELSFSTPIASSDFFTTTNYRNCIHASTIAIHNHFASLLFNGELDRIVYASTEFAFRERTKRIKSQNLDLPFMNIHIEQGGILNEVKRTWWNHIANIRGVWIDTLGRNLRFTPITINYDSTLFVHKDIDAMFAVSELFWDESNETQIRPKVIIDDTEIEIPGNLGYRLNPYAQYAEKDWLESNKMIAIQVNMTLETMMLKDNSNITIPQTVILEFGHGLGIASENPVDTYTATIDHLNQTVDWNYIPT